jgi:uncharacterized protein (TIGR03437 family)
MKQILIWRALIAILAFPIVAPADLNQTTTLEVNTTLNLDTGATAGSGGDLLWDANNLAAQGQAKVVPYAPLGPAAFEGLQERQIRTLATLGQTAAIPASILVVDEILIVLTNGGNVAKLLVTARNGTSITLRFTTFLTAPAGPTITSIVNNSSGIPPGFPNYGIAPSSLFLVIGSDLSDLGDPILQSSASGIPLTLNGTSLTVVVNGVTTHPALWYTSPNQVAAVLPAATPVGDGTLTLTHNGTASPPAPIRIVPSALGFNSYGQGLGVATDALSGALLTFTNSGYPGQIIVLWATGLGANLADSDTVFTTTPHSVPTPLRIEIGGVEAKILYQGSSGFPGVNQINVTIPESVSTGCRVPLVGITGTISSNVVTLPIHPGGGACIDALIGLNGNQISGSTVRSGALVASKNDILYADGSRAVGDAAGAVFVESTGLVETSTNTLPSPGGCITLSQIAQPEEPPQGGASKLLDAGAITVSGPSGLDVPLDLVFGVTEGSYLAYLPGGAIIPSSGGTITFHVGGGADVGPFTASLEFSNPLITWTNEDAATVIDRSQNLVVRWTGGNPDSFVVLGGYSSTANPNGSGMLHGAFNCVARVGDGQFAVPSHVLLSLPAGNGIFGVNNYFYKFFTAADLDIGGILGSVGFQQTSEFR